MRLSGRRFQSFKRVLVGVVVVLGCLQLVSIANALISPWSPSALTDISTYDKTSCGIANGKAYCWGLGTSGQLGNGGSTNSLVPVPVDTSGVLKGKTVTDVSVGLTFACAVADAKPYCWGVGTNGRLGNGGTANSSVPVAVTTSGVLSGKTVTAIALGDGHACVIATSLAYCWGAGGSGRLGNNGTAQSTTPVAVTATGVLSGKTITDIGAGSAFSCAVGSGAAYCWGLNTSGQLGNNSTTQSNVPVATTATGVLSGKTVTAISTGNVAACVVASGGAFCWGANTNGQLGNNSTAQSNVAVAVDTTGVLSGKTISKISQGVGRSCAIDSAGAAYCWGTAYLGSGSSSNSSVPVAVSTSGILSGVTWKAVNAGNSTCMLSTVDEAYCWGANDVGQAGDNTTTTPRSTPVQVLFGNNTANSAYRFYANANSLTPGTPLADTNTPAQLSSNGQAFRLRTDVNGNNAPVANAITGGELHSCVLTAGAPMCWGDNSVGQLGDNTLTDSLTPINVVTSGVLSGKTITSIAGAGYHTCVVASGAPFCWGENANGEFGNNSTTNSSVPVATTTSGVLSGKTVTSIQMGSNHTCVLASGKPYCWGGNGWGQLGNGTNANSLVPVAVNTSGALNGKVITALDLGDEYTCVIASGAPYCWGRSDQGEFGAGAMTDSNVPVATTTSGVLNGKTATAISAGYQHTCAVASGAAFCWGRNANGELGNNSTTNSNVPVAVNTAGVLSGKTISSITIGGNHACAVGDDKFYCWGRGAANQLGNNSTSNSLVPVAVTATGVLNGKSADVVMSGHNNHTCGIASGETYCWGQNDNGQIGNNSTSNAATPATAASAVVSMRIDADAVSYKLQFAQKTADVCGAQTTGFADVTTSSAIAYSTNAGATNGATISTTANDPTPASNTTPARYVSAAGSFTNPTTLPAGNAGLYDFSLKDNGASPTTAYCLRMTYSDGTALETAQQFPELTTASGVLSVDIVDGAGSNVSSPSFPMSAANVSLSCQTTTGTLGTSTQKLRITNGVSATGWSVSFTATSGATALWNRSDNSAKYDFNDSSGSPAGCNSGSDGDGYAGQLTLDPPASTITPQSGCTNTGVSKGTNTGFVQGTTNTITLASASSSAAVGCYWDITGIGMSQKVPASQAMGAYSVDMTATVVAL